MSPAIPSKIIRSSNLLDWRLEMSLTAFWLISITTSWPITEFSNLKSKFKIWGLDNVKISVVSGSLPQRTLLPFSFSIFVSPAEIKPGGELNCNKLDFDKSEIGSSPRLLPKVRLTWFFKLRDFGINFTLPLLGTTVSAL